MQAKITKRMVDGTAATNRDLVVWDTDMSGFGLRCRVSGAKYYVVKFRARGRARWYTIGRHGSPWTPDGARREARRILGDVAAGHDPASLRDSHRNAPTVAKLGERFLGDYVPYRCKPSTQGEYRRSVELFIDPALGSRRVIDITRADVAHLHHQLRKTPYQANRTLGILRKMLNLAEVWGYRPEGSNPCRHVEKYKERARERFLSAEELARLGEALSASETDSTVSPAAIAAIRLLVFTGARLSEILTLKWEYVDLAHQYLRLPDSKTGSKSVYLNPPALDLLQALPHVEDNPYVIIGHKPGQHLVDLQKPWRRIRAKAGLDNLRIHDLRHSFASVGAAGGVSLTIIGKLLGHSQPATTHRYAHLADDPLQKANAMIGARLAAAMKGNSDEENVVDLATKIETGSR